MAVSEVQQLQNRLDALEERMFGAPAGAASAGAPRKIADGLGKVQGSLGNIASKRERVKILFKKIEDILKYLDPQYIDRMAVPDAMKLQFILAEEQSIMTQAGLLEQVKSLQPYLDSAHIKASPDHATKLQRLSQIHLQQQDQCEAVTETIRLLLEDYNKMTLLLSKQFVQWDEMLTQLEAGLKQEIPSAELIKIKTPDRVHRQSFHKLLSLPMMARNATEKRDGHGTQDTMEDRARTCMTPQGILQRNICKVEHASSRPLDRSSL